ncbi:MAG: Crp/Fnr family transcriptional regulator [Saprospiraceae bacterium]|nr:Crp/Fnr family transcriptional regulator [Saprospiraceae bacterium]
MERFIQHISNTLSISDHHLEMVLGKLVEKHFAKKEHLLYFENYANELYFTLKGCVRTYVSDYNGVEHNISFSIENWWSGDLQSFINRTPAICNIQVLEDTTVLAINQANWDFLIKEVPEFVSYTRVLFRNKMFSQQNRIVQNLSYTAEERYNFFLDEYPDVAQRIPQKHIASYLGITPEFLNMIRSKRNRIDSTLYS